MPSAPRPAASLDILRTLRRAVAAWWQDFAPITFLGFALLTLPSVLLRGALGGERIATDPMLGTLVQTLLGVLAMFFICAVSFPVLATLSGAQLDTRGFMRHGLAAARRGLPVALLLAVGAMSIAILLVLARLAGGAGALLALPAMAAALWGLAVCLPAIPAAIVEQRGPMEALLRAAELTRGNRARLALLCLGLGLALLPVATLVGAVALGPAQTAAQAREAAASLTLLSPGLWVAQLADLLLVGLLACVPPAAYIELRGPRR